MHALAPRLGLFIGHEDEVPYDVPDLLAAIAPADIVIVEGFKKSSIPKIEIHRAELAHPYLFSDDPLIIAIASNDHASLPADAPFSMDLDQPDSIVDFIIQRHHQQTGAAAS